MNEEHARCKANASGDACGWTASYRRGRLRSGRTESVVEVTAGGSFDDVKQQLVLAIENRGLIVNHESKVGEMLERTGQRLGRRQADLYPGRGAGVLQRGAVAPGDGGRSRVAGSVPLRSRDLHACRGEADSVHLVYRAAAIGGSPAAAQVLQRVDRLLHEIVQDAGQ